MPEAAKRPLSRLEQVEAKDVREGFDSAAARLTGSRARIVLARRVADGLLRVESERTGYSADEPDPLMPRLPQRELLVQRSVNRMVGDRPYCHRTAQGGSHAAGKAADEAERWLNAATDLTYPYESSVGLAHEGEWLTIVQPSPTFYRRTPDIIDLHTKQRRRGARKPAEYRKQRERFLAGRPPWICRLVSATDCAPVLVRGRGKYRWEVDKVYIRTLFDVDDLIDQGFIFDADKVGQLVPRGWESGNPYGQSGQVFLYELFATIDGDPCVAYSVAGLPTKKFGMKREDEQVTRINLAEEYGIHELPVGYFYGLNQDWRDDPDAIGRPYLYALCDLILAAEGTLGAINVATWENAFTGHVTELPDPSKVDLTHFMEGGQLKRFVKPAYDEVVMMPGATVPFMQAQVGPDAWRVLESVLGLLQSNAPAEELGGGGQLASGHTGTVLDELDKAANRQIPEGCRRSIEFAAEQIATLCGALSRGEWRVLDGAEGVNVPLYVNEESEPEPGRVEVYTRPLEYKDSWFADVYDVEARFPQRGNLAETQQELAMWQAGAATLDDVLEKRGKTATTFEKVKIFLDRELQNPESPAARELRMYAMEYSGREAQAKALRLQEQGELTAGGMPTAAMGGQTGGQPPSEPPAPIGTKLPNIPASILGGAVAGEMSTGPELLDERARQQIQAPPMNGVAV